MTIDATALVAAYQDRVRLTPINTGNARRHPAVRGAATFVPYAEWLQSRWASEASGLGTRERRPSHPPVELTVSGSVPDVMRFLLATDRLEPGQPFAATPA
jgi:hypothetical protein